MTAKNSRIDNSLTYDVGCATLDGTLVVKFIIDPKSSYIVGFQLIKKETGEVQNAVWTSPTSPLEKAKIERLLKNLTTGRVAPDIDALTPGSRRLLGGPTLKSGIEKLFASLVRRARR